MMDWKSSTEMRWRWAIVLAGSALAIATGCGSGRTLGSTSTPASASKVDFATQIQPIFTQNCALSGCHAADSPSGDLVLDPGQAYDNLVNMESSEVGPKKRVEPGNSAASFLYEKISQPQPTSGDRMPLISNPLSADKIALIKAWIDEGAKPTASVAAVGTRRRGS
jgi:hypothetical protein